MTLEELAKSLFEISYITGNFTLRSGIVSNEYFDKYQFESKPRLLEAIAYYLNQKIDFDYDYLAALEMGGIPIATALSILNSKPMVFVRKTPKEYGTQKFAEGPSVNGKKLLIIEDVITSGGQVIISTEQLRKEGAIIDKALCVIDREAGGSESLQKNGIHLIPLFNMNDMKNFKK